MFKTTVAAGALAFLGTVMMMPVTTSQVMAVPLTQINPLLPDLQTANPKVEQAAVRRKWKNKRRWSGNRWRGGRHYGWNRHYHGSRYRYRYGRYRHYHDGYYYASPWWLLAPFAYGVGVATAPYYYGGYNSGYSRHDRWCLNRYRSYNPRTNTYVGYDGYRHRCRSPYGY